MSLRAAPGAGPVGRVSVRQSETGQGFSMAKRLNGQYTKEQVEQVLGRTTRLYTVHLLGPEGDDDDSGKKFWQLFLFVQNTE